MNRGSGAQDAELAPSALLELEDEPLLERVQRQTFRFFWEGAHPVSALAPDRRTRRRTAG